MPACLDKLPLLLHIYPCKQTFLSYYLHDCTNSMAAIKIGFTIGFTFLSLFYNSLISVGSKRLLRNLKNKQVYYKKISRKLVRMFPVQYKY